MAKMFIDDQNLICTEGLTKIVQQCDGDTGSAGLIIGKENVPIEEHADVVYVGRGCNTVAKVFFAIISYKIVFTLPQTLQMYRNVEGLTGAQVVIKT